MGRVTPMAEDAAVLHRLMALFSPAYPVGGFAYSHGLEAAIADGQVTTAADLRGWIADVLCYGAGRTDAILLAHTARAPARADALSDLALALATSRERAQETQAQGAAFAQVTAAVHGGDATPRPFPVAAGLAAAALDLPVRAVASAYLHAFASNLVSAGVRFMPLGQTEGQAVLAALFPALEAVVDEALAADLDDIGGAALLSDLAAMAHETMTTRIFRS